MRTYNECEIELHMSTMLKFKYYGTPWNVNKIRAVIHWEYMHYGNFTDIKRISQDFSDCGLHNDKYTKFQPCENCELRASSKVAPTPDSLYIPSTNPKNSGQDFESRSKIKNRHLTIESDTGLQLLPFLFGFFC